MGMLTAMLKRLKAWQRAARNREAAAYDSYTATASYPLFLLGLLFLIAFIITVTPNSPAPDQQFARVVIGVTWVAFAVDYAISIILSPHRGHYVRTHLLQLAALLFPPLRVLLLGHVFHVLRTTPIRRGDRARTYVLYLTTLLLVVGAALVVFFEAQSPDANIKSFGDALWWGGETVSTVGYGDYYPVTVGGRLVAGVLFVNGVALLSIITAGLAQNFTSDDGRTPGGGSSAPAAAAPAAGSTVGPPETLAAAGAMAMLPLTRADLEALHSRLDRIEAALEHMSDRVGAVLDSAGDTPTNDTPGPSRPQP
jgi:voltage-gated potassium channel